MKTLLVVAAVVLGSEAAACSLCTGGWGGSLSGPPRNSGIVFSGILLAGGVTSIGGIAGFTDRDLSALWSIAPTVIGAVNLITAAVIVFTIADEAEPLKAELVAGHVATGAIAFILGCVGLALKSYQRNHPVVTPAVIGGKDAAGQRWAGLGVTVSNW